MRRAACHELVNVNGLPECYLRPIAFFGYGELGVHTRGAIGPTAVGMDLADLVGERLVSHGPLRRRPARPGVIARACHTQHAGKTGDTVVCFLRLDQPITAHR